MDKSDDFLNPSHQRDLSDAEVETYVNTLNGGYSNDEPLGKFVTRMIEEGISQRQRNRMIMSSDYALDSKVRDSILLFGL